MTTKRLQAARKDADEAYKELEDCTRIWSECVTNLHMAELKLKKAQAHSRNAYFMVTDVLNGEADAKPVA